MAFTINAGGTSWDSTSTACTFGVHADGTGSLDAEFEGGAVAFPPLSLIFVIVDPNEILPIRTDAVVASGVLRRQAH